ncbi:MAG TPA: hypothetical protein VHS53_06835 [Mucilaginibacter sp.]|nr:hypothetical protein [Mucilaginibacter sp.]
MKTFMAIAICLILFFSGCAQKKNNLVAPNTGFPNKAGNQYTYQVSDSIHNNIYTVNVKIGAMSSLDNGTPATMWIYSYPDHIDTTYVTANQDSVVFYGNKQTSPVKINIINLYHFPLTVGARWRTSFAGDTSNVIGVSNVTIESKVYRNTYHISDYGRSYNYSISKGIWYTPDIGMVRMDYKTLGVNETWQLVNYVIN